MREAQKSAINGMLGQLCEKIGADALSVYESDTAAEKAELLAWSGGEKPRDTAPFDLAPIGTCAKLGKGMLIEKKHEDPEKYQSIAVVPVEKEGTIFGVLTAASRQSGYFKQNSQLVALRAIAESLALFWVGTGSLQEH